MKELKPRIHENGIDYILVGDYYVPDWKLPEEHRPIGRWGNLHRAYLRQFCPALYSTLVLSGELHTYLADLNEQATERCSLIIEQMAEAEGVDEAMKAENQMLWVQSMNSFVAEFWHCECVCERSEKAFTNKYQRWCRKHGYNFSEEKAHTIYDEVSGHIGVMPKVETTKLLVEQAVSQLRATSTALAALKQEMQSLASQLPEYPIVMEMFGVGPTLGPQLIAEIGDVRRFYSKKALVAYAGIDAPPNDSGDVIGRHKSMSKVGASSLRRTLFLVMSVYLQNSPLDEPIYQFMDRKRAEGKPYRVYMMASANKFLRIYYATVKAYLESLEQV